MYEFSSHESSDESSELVFNFALVNPFVKDVHQALDLTEPAPVEPTQRYFLSILASKNTPFLSWRRLRSSLQRSGLSQSVNPLFRTVWRSDIPSGK